jgi:hypothetical protein
MAKGKGKQATARPKPTAEEKVAALRAKLNRFILALGQCINDVDEVRYDDDVDLRNVSDCDLEDVRYQIEEALRHLAVVFATATAK